MDPKRSGTTLGLLVVASSVLSAQPQSQDENRPAPLSIGTRQPPRPGPDFPNLAAYYPMEARRAGQQGSVVIHFCVDPHGRLTEPPSLGGSSGNDVLDNAAINLASAASGHYLPGSRGGEAIASCSNFKITFQLRQDPFQLEDPRFPTISTRMVKLNAEYARRVSEVGKTFSLPTSAMAAARPHSVSEVRQYARNLDSALDETAGIYADFLDDLEYLGKEPDIPQAERTVFLQVWPDERAGLAVQFREVLGATRDVVRAMDEMGDYLSFSSQRRPKSEAAGQSPAPVEDPEVIAIRERALNAIRRLQNSIGAPPKDLPAEGE